MNKLDSQAWEIQRIILLVLGTQLQSFSDFKLSLTDHIWKEQDLVMLKTVKIIIKR